MDTKQIFKIALLMQSIIAIASQGYAQLPSSKPMNAFYSKSTKEKLDRKKNSNSTIPITGQQSMQSQKSLQQLTVTNTKIKAQPVVHANDRLSAQQKKEGLPSNTVALYKKKTTPVK